MENAVILSVEEYDKIKNTQEQNRQLKIANLDLENKLSEFVESYGRISDRTDTMIMESVLKQRIAEKFGEEFKNSIFKIYALPTNQIKILGECRQEEVLTVGGDLDIEQSTMYYIKDADSDLYAKSGVDTPTYVKDKKVAVALYMESHIMEDLLKKDDPYKNLAFMMQQENHFPSWIINGLSDGFLKVMPVTITTIKEEGVWA